LARVSFPAAALYWAYRTHYRKDSPTTLCVSFSAFLHGEEPIEEPVFLKEDNSAEQQLADLRALYAEARGAGAPKELLVDIERDGKLVDYGIAGEGQLAFELANSQQLQRHMELVKQIGAAEKGTAARFGFNRWLDATTSRSKSGR